jgi:hypothetical protein
MNCSARRFSSGPELPCAGRRVLEPTRHVPAPDPGAALSQGVGTGAAVTRNTPGAALSWEVGTGAAVTHDAPGAALRGPGAALSQEVGTGAAVTHGAPRGALHGPGATLNWEVGTRATLRREAGAPGGNRSRSDTRRPRSCPASGGGCCPRSCPEPVYYWLFLVISSWSSCTAPPSTVGF